MDWSIAVILYFVIGIVFFGHYHIANYPVLYWTEAERLKAAAFLILAWPIYVAQVVIGWFRS